MKGQALVYNASIFGGVVLTCVGVSMEFGLGFGLTAAGLLIVGITISVLRLLVRGSAKCSCPLTRSIAHRR
jgi:hypothetical protein